MKVERLPCTDSASTGRTSSKAESLPKRWLTNTPAASRTPLPSSIRASPRAAVPKIVSPSEKALRNSVLSP